MFQQSVNIVSDIMHLTWKLEHISVCVESNQTPTADCGFSQLQVSSKANAINICTCRGSHRLRLTRVFGCLWPNHGEQ